ncbi:Major facilitator family transporter [Bacillus cereus 95/8201]|uniref:MFS transporter n=5 Tax=Bacillus cereus group TaxID=86661 RepID=A0A0F7R4Q4_BACAN|nr:MFS transporter [Bacillus anthracis str. Ames]AAT34851.2 major facilitator family transporter [Bacillus anthracis str. 'Ames Ancestor']ACP12588.1 MFS transporter [Bacillus anthracis str. CDC 684]ACQ48119.1 major facilitator family transporter [Bacillus anthracis str. A0248]AFH86820.1 Major facilitator family transporter [Bacillus anthracis str. H9401]AHK41580.1 Major facilitator family transporter [Bacillus anthracis str. SVA11]AIM09323.1 major facilitator family transporter [Bacillus anth
MMNVTTDVQSTTEETKEKRYKTLFGSALGYAAEGLDMLLLSFVLVYILKEFHLSPVEGGNLTLATTIGMLIGSYLFGFIADLFGRIRTMAFTILLFSLATALIYFATDYWQLLILRFLVGMGVGGEFGIGMAIVTETWSKEMRAKATSVVALGWQFGVLIASLLPAFIVPHFGWRAVFLFGLIPALLAVYVRKSLSEPKIWEQKQRYKKELLQKEAEGNLTTTEAAQLKQMKKFPLRKLFANKKVTITTIGLIIMSFIQNFGYYGIFTWMPTILANKYNYTLAKASGWMFISTIGMLIGIATFGILADKIGRRKTFTIYYVGGTIYCLIYFFLFTDSTLLLWGSALLGFFANGMMGGFGAVLAENYPAEARSTAENFIFGTGRGLAGFGPVIIGLLAAGGNLMGALSLIFIIYPIGLVTMLLCVPETKDKVLE